MAKSAGTVPLLSIAGHGMVISSSNIHKGLILHLVDLQVAQIQVIFKLPDRFATMLFGIGAKPPGLLAYIEWFTKLHAKGPDHWLYAVTWSKQDDD
jgi:hypothetical protein